MISCLFKPIRIGALLLMVMLTMSFSPPALQELIVQVPKISEKNQPNIAATLVQQNGISVNGYCGEQKIFLLLVDRSRQPGNEFLHTVFQQYQLEYHVKESCTIAQVRAMCGMPANNSSPNPSTN
jgi:hypothetical protein